MPEPRVWFMTTGEAGYRTQARGLARSLSEKAREWVVGLNAPWRWLPLRLFPSIFKKSRRVVLLM